MTVTSLNQKSKDKKNPPLTNQQLTEQIAATKGLKSWVFLVKERRMDSTGLKIYFFEMMLVREILAVFLVIFLVTSGYLQIFSLIALTVWAIIMLIKVQPYRRKFQTYMTIAIESCYLLIYLLFLWLKVSEGKMSKDSRYNFLGKAIIVIFIVILVLYVLMGLVGTILSLRKFCKRRKIAQAESEKLSGAKTTKLEPKEGYGADEIHATPAKVQQVSSRGKDGRAEF